VKARWEASGDLAPPELETEPIQVRLPIPLTFPKPSRLALRGKVRGWGLEQPEGGGEWLRANLDLELVNLGSRPVLVLKAECTGYGEYVLGSTKLLDDQNAGRVLADWSAWYSRDTSQMWQDMRKEMENTGSPEEHFWVIQPGASRTFESTARVPVDECTACFPPRPRPAELWKHPNLWMVVQISIWPGNLEPKGGDNPEFGRMLRERWSKVGVLELGEEGILESQPIPVKLPERP
jgi:hypothetical protein